MHCVHRPAVARGAPGVLKLEPVDGSQVVVLVVEIHEHGVVVCVGDEGEGEEKAELFPVVVDDPVDPRLNKRLDLLSLQWVGFTCAWVHRGEAGCQAQTRCTGNQDGANLILH